MPCQAVYNTLELLEFPEGSLNKLETVIISRRILFSKVVIMPKGLFSKIKGEVFNVPVEEDSMCNILQRGTDSNGFILMKLKRNLS